MYFVDIYFLIRIIVDMKLVDIVIIFVKWYYFSFKF